MRPSNQTPEGYQISKGSVKRKETFCLPGGCLRSLFLGGRVVAHTNSKKVFENSFPSAGGLFPESLSNHQIGFYLLCLFVFIATKN
jgi:hypothetical protein